MAIVARFLEYMTTSDENIKEVGNEIGCRRRAESQPVEGNASTTRKLTLKISHVYLDIHLQYKLGYSQLLGTEKN